MNIKISVVIPTYNRPKLLLKCLKALADQHFKKTEYEIIIVSDGPDPQTKKIMNDWQIRKRVSLRFFSLPSKKGPAAARNYGWLNARGILVAFTDDDCVPDKNWLSAFYNKHTADAEMAMSGKTIVPISKKPTDYELNIANLQTAEFITANCCCTKKALSIAGGFDEQFTMAWREDSDLEFKLIKEGISIRKVNQAVVVHPIRETQWGISIKDQKKTMFNALLYKKYPELYRQKIQPSPPIHYYVIIVAFLIMLTGLIVKTPEMYIGGFMLWMSFSLLFIFRRVRSTTLAMSHLFEMAITSLCIPFISIYWQFYGAIKYRVLFL
ncbi:MAG: glycosyl transferase family 2 [Mucilaginibacter sp.]|jgi:glycosyltransferase involved in cell wall biosynthesis|nr:glycosyl transferase family 2 [Mucilaginibacter sp.]MDB5017242.1 glycosyl transferase family 2 [Mucilaginibacter sp.]MDB5140123.1 glycosyl transferase family 2 [Mucilaginibacter sp.]